VKRLKFSVEEFKCVGDIWFTYVAMISAEGAGGKGTWGKLLDTDDGDSCIDKNDPNYDSGEVLSYLRLLFCVGYFSLFL